MVFFAQPDGQWANTAATGEKGMEVRDTDFRDEGQAPPPGEPHKAAAVLAQGKHMEEEAEGCLSQLCTRAWR